MKKLLIAFAMLGFASVSQASVGGTLAGVTNDTVYLMCYHEGGYPAGGGSGVFLSWSTNGYTFNPLNGGHPVFVPPEFPGDDAEDANPNLVRDPSMVYGPDGLFHLVFTSAIWSRSFGYAESPDLVHWSNVKLVQIWANTADSVGVTWAPEVFYGEDTGEYTVIFSSDVAGGTRHMYYTQTTDFETFDDPQDFYENPTGSWEQIDGCVAKVSAGHYVMAYKDNSQIWILDGDSPVGPWTNRRQATGSPREGPSLIKIDGVWHLYSDYFTGLSDDVFRMSTSTDLTNWTDHTAETRLPAKVDVPDYGYDGNPPHHCTVFAAPLSALEAFTQPLQDNVTNLSSLVYRWSFNDTAGSATNGTTLVDSISGAEAVVTGNRASLTGTGLLLPGDTSGTGDAAYLDLPAGIISSNTDMTVEIWATAVMSKNWQRLFSFGSGNTDDVMFWSINQGNNNSQQRLAMQLNGGSLAQSDTCVDSTLGTRYHYVFTFEAGIGFFGSTGGRMTFYRDGNQIGWRDVSFQLKDIQDVNNWLGRSQWSSDSNSNVEYDEVRIYSSALSWYDIYGHYLAGSDVLVNESPSIALAVDGNNMTLNWPGNTVGYLQEASALGMPTVWTAVTNEPQSSTNGLSVALPMTNDTVFYRLGN